MIARALLLASGFPLLPSPAAAQISRHVLKGDSVAIYNLVGELRVEAGTGSDVVVELTRGGADAGKLDVQTGPVWGRGWNTTLRVRDDGTFGEEHGRHDRRGWFREGHEVRITGRGRGGLEAHA